MQVLLLLGKVHKLEVGAKRFVDGLLNDSFKSGVFYASQSGLTGKLVEQGTLFADLNNEKFQDNARKAIDRFAR